MTASVGSPALEGATNPFDAASGSSSVVTPYVMAPAPSGGDDLATIQPLITANAPLGITTIFADAEYLLSGELMIPATAHGEILRGTPGKYDVAEGTRFKLTGAARSCLATTNVYNVQISGIKFDANRLGTYAAYLNGLTWSKIEDCVFENAIIDGKFMAAGPLLQDSNRFINNTYYFNGTTYATAGCIAQYTHGSRVVIAGTATTVVGNPVINFVGAPDLTTFGFRKGDFLRVGATLTGQLMQIESVAASAITVQINSGGLPTINAAGQDFAFGLGDGVHEVRQSNNNLDLYMMCTTRGNGGSGFRFNGLYGPTVIGGQADFNNFFAVSIGESDNATVMFTGSISHLYVEGNDTADFFLGQALGIDISGANGASEPTIAGVTLATGTFNGEDIQNGADVSFVFAIQNNAGTLEGKFKSDFFSDTGLGAFTKISNTVGAFTALASVAAGVGFGAIGAGISAASPNLLVFDCPNAQNMILNATAILEANSTGLGNRISPSVVSLNINGVTKPRLALRLIDGSTPPTQQNWDTTQIPAGKMLVIRVNPRMK